MAVDIQFLINGQDRGQPLNAKDFGVSITESIEINARIVTFDNELIFGNDMYTYLFDRLTDTGFCNLVEVEVHYECDGGWVKLTNGYIVVSECSFDLDKCQVKTKLYDDTFSTRINNNKSIPFSLSLTTSKNGNVVIPPKIIYGNFFSPATGLYDYEFVGVCPVYLAFKHLVNCMSDGLVDFESTLFYWQEDTSYDSTLIITNGNALRNRNLFETVVSFEQLYIALKKKLNLGMGFERQSNGRPLLRIELESYFYQSGVDVNLYDQPSINLTFDKERLYQAVNFGSDPYLEKEECNNGATSCTFIQTPFRGFRDEIFGFSGECNTSAILELSTNDVIFDTNVIEDIFQYNVDRYDTNPIIVDAHYYSSSTSYEMNKFDPYGLAIPQTVYNGDFRNILVSSNWLNGYPNSLYSFLTTPFDPATTISQANIIDDSQIYTLDPTIDTWLRYSIATGLWLKFLTPTFDPYNLFDGISYQCPYVGIYTVNSRVVFGFLEPLELDRQRQYETIITHMNADEDVIEEFYHGPVADFGNVDQFMTFNKTFICNTGDFIRIDARVKSAFATVFYPPDQRFLDNAVIGGETRFSYFNVSGEPLNPLNPDEVLDPVNVDDVRAYLYDFERPLTMAEIQLLLDNTSKPVSFGKYDDPLRVIEGFIKKVNIPSITRQKASIELKSNRLLR